MGGASQAMKSVLLLLPIVCAFAALGPDAVVPEEIMVETLSDAQAVSASVSSLEKQYKQLALQLKGTSGASVTPQVASTIATMINLVTDEIEPAIKQAHQADQEL